MTETSSNEPAPNPTPTPGIRLNVDRYHDWVRRLTEVGIVKPEGKPKPKRKAGDPAKARDHSHLKQYQWTPEQLAKGRSALALRQEVRKMFRARTGYLHMLSCGNHKPKAWLKAEWDKLIALYHKAKLNENSSNA